MGSRILIVDDDPWLLQMVETVLARRGYAVDTAGDGHEGYRKAIAFRPDLIISDVAMPNLDGWGFARAVRSRGDLAHVPFIFLSAHVAEYEPSVGGDDYLPKPFRFEELEVRVARLLGTPEPATAERKPPPIPPRLTPSQVTALPKTPSQTGAVERRPPTGSSPLGPSGPPPPPSAPPGQPLTQRRPAPPSQPPQQRPPTPAAVPIAPSSAPGHDAAKALGTSTARQGTPAAVAAVSPATRSPISPAQRSTRTPTPASVAAVAPPKKGIHGSLDQLGLPSLLMMLEMERKSGILVVEQDGRSARMFVRDGKLLSARIDHEPLKGPDCVYHLLTWERGHFEFNALNVEMADEMGVSTQHLLMEGARLIDEGKVPRR